MILNNFSKEQLQELVQIYARNIYAMDGVWFQSVEQKHGMDEAMFHDRNAMQRFTEAEARRIKAFLQLPEYSGLEGLEKALSVRFSALANPEVEVVRDEYSLLYRVVDCRVQTARGRKGMPFHPCKPVGFVEHACFAKVIDERIVCETVSCYPDIVDDTCACAWKFTIKV